MKTRTYATILVSGALALLAFGATMIVHGGWQAVLAASPFSPEAHFSRA
jgi:hypothetical protein